MAFMHLSAVTTRPPALLDYLLAIWEASVRATHHFLSNDDICSIKPLVQAGLRDVPALVVMSRENDIPVGFMGVEGSKVEALFISPDALGQGLGRRMIEYAVREYGVDCLDVNEQNPQAVGFYLHLGFEVAGRSETDVQGNPFPILHLKLRDIAESEAGGF